jgi:hypothetical protein
MLNLVDILHALRAVTPYNSLTYDAADLIKQQAAEIDRLREAFKPFAKIKIKDHLPDETLVVIMDFDGYVVALPGHRAFTVGEFRRLQATFERLVRENG